MAWERINIPPVIIAGVAWMAVESRQGQQVAVSQRPPEETCASDSGPLRLDTGTKDKYLIYSTQAEPKCLWVLIMSNSLNQRLPLEPINIY